MSKIGPAKPLNSQAREIVYNVYSYFERLADENAKKKGIKKQTSDATGKYSLHLAVQESG